MDSQSLLNLDAYDTEALGVPVRGASYQPDQAGAEWLNQITQGLYSIGVPAKKEDMKAAGDTSGGSSATFLPGEDTTAARRFAPMRARMEYMDMMNSALQLRNRTEGNIASPYQDSNNTIAIGMGLNLSVQDKASLSRLVGNDPALVAKFSPFVGRSYSSLTDAEKAKLTLTPEESRALNSYMVSSSIDSVLPFAGNMSDVGIVVLSDIQHYTGDRGLRAAKSKIGGKTKDGKPINYVSNAVMSGKADDAALRDAIVKTVEDPNVNATTKARFKKYLEIL